MAGYLDEYGVADARRAKVIRWIVLSAIFIGISWLVLYFTLRTWPAKRQVNTFLADLRQHDYKTAYRDWGCGKGCPDYKFDSFLQDWGPKSPFADAAAASIKKSRFCDTGVIVTLSPGRGDNVALWYERDTGTLGFAPWPVCAPRIPAPSTSTPSR